MEIQEVSNQERLNLRKEYIIILINHLHPTYIQIIHKLLLQQSKVKTLRILIKMLVIMLNKDLALKATICRKYHLQKIHQMKILSILIKIKRVEFNQLNKLKISQLTKIENHLLLTIMFSTRMIFTTLRNLLNLILILTSQLILQAEISSKISIK